MKTYFYTKGCVRRPRFDGEVQCIFDYRVVKELYRQPWSVAKCGFRTSLRFFTVNSTAVPRPGFFNHDSLAFICNYDSTTTKFGWKFLRVIVSGWTLLHLCKTCFYFQKKGLPLMFWSSVQCSVNHFWKIRVQNKLNVRLATAKVIASDYPKKPCFYTCMYNVTPINSYDLFNDCFVHFKSGCINWWCMIVQVSGCSPESHWWRQWLKFRQPVQKLWGSHHRFDSDEGFRSGCWNITVTVNISSPPQDFTANHTSPTLNNTALRLKIVSKIWYIFAFEADIFQSLFQPRSLSSRDGAFYLIPYN